MLKLNLITDRNKLLSQEEKIIIEILYRYNCRISEVLRAEWKKFFPPMYLTLSGAKKSKPVIIRDTSILSMINELPRLNQTLIFPTTSYQRLYRCIKSQYGHLFHKFKTKKNEKVTHGFRYLNVQTNIDDDTASTVLHHRSKKSLKYYRK